MKKTIVILLFTVSFLMLFLSSCDTSTFDTANESGYSLEYELNKDGVSYAVTENDYDSYFNQPTEVVIPDTYNGLPVTQIGENAFSSQGKIEKIVLPEGITSIGAGAFKSCSALKEINLSQNLETIYEEAFRNCYSLDISLHFENKIYIGDMAFSDCSKIKSVYFGDARIDYRAFEDCKSLTKLTLKSGSIHERAFSFAALEEVNLGKGVYFLGTYCFVGCEDLYYINYDGTSKEWWEIETETFWSSGENYTIRFSDGTSF